MLISSRHMHYTYSETDALVDGVVLVWQFLLLHFGGMAGSYDQPNSSYTL